METDKTTETPPVMPTINGLVQQCEKCDEASVPSRAVHEETVDKKDGEPDVVVVTDRKTVEGFCAKHGGVADAPYNRTAEEWATLRGYLPVMSPGQKKPGKPDAIVPPVHNPKSRLHFEAFFLHGWAELRELTLVEYDVAVEAARTHVYR